MTIKTSATDAGLPETDKEWDDFFKANHWRGSEHEDDNVSTAGDYAADSSGRSAPEPYHAPSRDTDDHEQTVCHNCASYMANGEGDPDHENRFDQGMRDLASRGIHSQNLTFNDIDDEDNRIPPTGHECFVCGERVDPDLENFHGNRGEGTIGTRMHLFQPGETGYYSPERRVGAVSRASDTVWR